ncbi:Glyoxysomal fatty acid beta-oxidation multifunctional protein MFP-a, partial [Glycine soja]
AAWKPLVAAIDGLALGGGLEFAMTPIAQPGLPELQLGIISGLVGTLRLPRLVGLTKALEMMLTSKPVKGKEASSLGLVDGLVSPDDLVNTACQWALDIVGCRRPWIASLYKTDKLEPLGEAREILKFAQAQVLKWAPNLQHPLVCINVIEAGVVAGPHAGLWKFVICLQYTLSLFPLLYYCCRNVCDVVIDLCRKLMHLKDLKSETTRKGFYLYDDKRKASPDPELKNYIQKARSFTGFSVDPKVLQSKHLILIFLLSWAWVFHLRGEVSYSGLTLLDPSTYVQD